MIYNEEYIYQRVIADPDTGCWEWQFGCDKNGYGQISRRVSGESLAHRLAYKIFVGPVAGLIVRHSCDNPPCCNPDHLIGGTQAENLADARQKGRMITNKPVKFTREIQSLIKQRLINDDIQADIARDFKISPSHLSLIKYRIMKDDTL